MGIEFYVTEISAFIHGDIASSIESAKIPSVFSSFQIVSSRKMFQNH